MFSIAAGILALLVAAFLSSSIMKADAGSKLMQEISGHIHEGAMAFLSREYRDVPDSADGALLWWRRAVLNFSRVLRHERGY